MAFEMLFSILQKTQRKKKRNQHGNYLDGFASFFSVGTYSALETS